MSDLPKLKQVSPLFAEKFIRAALSHDGDSSVERVTSHADGRFYAEFKSSYFVLPEGQNEPTKSQWNTLKKRLKRINRDIFIFKDHGMTKSGLCYLNFGFFNV